MGRAAEHPRGLDQGSGLRGAAGRATVGDFEYLFWVGCAGAFEDRAKKTTRAVATLLHEAGVSFAILGNGETCTGDPARRIGNEFVFQMLAQQNVETLNERRRQEDRRDLPALLQHPRQRVRRSSAATYEVVHHTQLLAAPGRRRAS